MRAKLLTALIVVSAALSIPAGAMTYVCPPPSQINCVPAIKTIGAWQDNNSQATGNMFGPNNQCANVIRLGPAQQRLLCCYTKCGVFLRDVPSTMCTKISQSQFECR